MRTIYKQQLEITDIQFIELPENSKILHLDNQGEHSVCIWYECETKNPKKRVTVYCFGTGHEMPNNDNLRYIGTALILEGRGVFHYYISE